MFAGAAAAAAVAVDLIGIRRITAYIVGRRTVSQQNGILAAAGGDCIHTQSVAGQHQTGLQIGAAVNANAVDRIFCCIKTGSSGNISPLHYGFCISAEGNHRQENLTAVVLGQAVQETVFARNRVLDGYHTGTGIAAAASFRTAGCAPCHRVGAVDDQLDGCIAGSNCLRGLHGQCNIKLILTGADCGLTDSETVLRMAVFVSRIGNGAVLVQDKVAVHYLLRICAYLQRDHTYQHNHAHKDR